MKKEKYQSTSFGNVIPVVMTPEFVFSKDSLHHLSKYLNLQKLLQVSGYYLSIMLTNKAEAYELANSVSNKDYVIA